MASARPIAVVRLSAKIDTSVAKEIERRTARAPSIAMHADGDRQRSRQQAAEHPDQHDEAQRDRERFHHQQVALRLVGDLDVDHRDAARPDGDTAAVVRHLVGQFLGVLLLVGFVADDARDDQSCGAVLADQVGGGRWRCGPRRADVRDVWRPAQLVDDVDACRCGGSAVDAVWGGDDDEQLHVALTKLARSASRSPGTTRRWGPEIRWRTGSWRREVRRRRARP